MQRSARLVFAVIAASGGSATAGGAESPPSPHQVVNPDWLRRPTSTGLLQVFPAEAARKGISGKATISCTVTIQGALANCATVAESPAGMGFGFAAIALTPQFLMRPQTIDGKPVASTVRIPINFVLPAGGLDTGLGSRKVVPANLAWTEAPSYADVAAAYPKKARAEKVGGRATLACDMGEDGRLRDCQLAVSEPKGYGFDVAAKALAKQFRIEVTSDAEKKATHSLSVHLPVTFDPSMLDSATPVIGKPGWASTPNGEQLHAAFDDLKITGTARVALTCIVQQGGRVDGCSIASEQPSGVGLGAAALTLAPKFRLTTWTAEGLPAVGGSVRIPLRYEGGPASEPTPPPK